MSTTNLRPAASRIEVVLPRPSKPEFKQLGGSDSDHFNQALASQTLAALWTANSDEEQRNNQYLAATAALIGAKPQDELERHARQPDGGRPRGRHGSFPPRRFGRADLRRPRGGAQVRRQAQ